MEYKRIIYKPGKVTQIIMNRPDKLNAISHPMYKELEDAFDRAAADPECKVIVHSGAGRSFSAGHDYVATSPECKPMLSDGRPVQELVKQYGSLETVGKVFMEQHRYFGYEVKLRWRNIPKPTIAMVQGYCIYGGFFSAAAMDLIFASEDALFLPNLGHHDAGPWFFGDRKYKELLFEHRFLSASEAKECGFVSRVYPNREILEKETLAYANNCADTWPIGHLRTIKETSNYMADLQGYSAAVTFSEWSHHRPTPALEPGLTASGGEFEGTGVSRVPVALAHLKAKQAAEKKKQGE